MTVSQLAYIGIGVSQMARWQTFATEVLGLQVVKGDDDTVYLRMDEYHHRLALHPTGEDDVLYVVTPSGFEVEYGWGGRLIDDSVWQVQRHDRGALWGHKVQVPATS